ncbi:MAG: flagellar protein FlbT [Desulfobacteraceae bacterium]|nr:flagellar protein FlbT [Desulfobacteraceae bacterium]
MALKISLKPNERIIIGGAVVTNGNSKCDLFFENKVPLLREKDIMSESAAETPASRIYFVIQLMYIDGENMAVHHQTYWKLVKAFLGAVPSALPIIDQINDHILKGNHYTGLKTAAKLIEYEQEVISRVSDSATSLPDS